MARINDVSAVDVALLDLYATGSTDAPISVLNVLAARGLIRMAAYRPFLTAAGRIRARKLKPFERDIRTAFSRVAGGGAHALRGVSGASVRS